MTIEQLTVCCFLLLTYFFSERDVVFLKDSDRLLHNIGTEKEKAHEGTVKVI